MELRGGQKGFGPLYSAQSRALILGSYPSPKSFEAQFFYGHPQNRFWPLIATLAGQPSPQTLAEKQRLILQHSLALWDSLERCDILGAADNTIQNPVPNNIAALVKKAPIQAVFCNGAAAHRYYRQFSEAKTGIPAIKLPSTSPANAAFSFEKLLAAWAPVQAYINPGPAFGA